MADKVTIARPYAKAAFEYALEAKTISAWQNFLALLAQTMQDSVMQKFCKNPYVTHNEIKKLLLNISSKNQDDAMRIFLELLTKRDRLSLLPEISMLFNYFYAQHENTVGAEVYSSVDLEKSQQEKLIKSLEKRLHKKVILNCHTDKSLLGGIIVRAGDLVIDGSLRGKLTRLTHDLVS